MILVQGTELFAPWFFTQMTIFATSMLTNFTNMQVSCVTCFVFTGRLFMLETTKSQISSIEKQIRSTQTLQS